MSRSLLLIVAVIAVSVTFAQNIIKFDKYYSGSVGGLCSHTLLLFRNHTFKSERGCEESSHISFGSWTQYKDTITFEPANIDKFKLIEKVISSKTPDEFLKVKVYDKHGNNITDKVSIGQYVDSIGLFIMKLDSSQTEKVDFKRKNGTIVINSSQKLLHQKIELPTDTLNNFEITLNTANSLFFNPNTTWDKEAFRLIKRNNKLFSLYPNQFIDGKLMVTEYIKQKE